MMKTNTKKIISALPLLAFVFITASCATTDFIAEAMLSTNDATVSAIGGAVKSINKATENFTPENEYYIGRSVVAAVVSKYPVKKVSKKVTDYLNNVCTSLTVNSALPYLYKGYYVAALDSDEINAISTPGGHILVSEGLIKSCETEDALASVIAHEIAHIQLRHSIKVIESSRITSASMDTAKAVSFVTYDYLSKDNDSEFKDDFKKTASSLWDVQNALVGTLVDSGYSKNQEYDADKYALQLMIDAGYNPKEMCKMLSSIEEKTSGGGWNKTHPSAKSRNEKVQNELKELKYTATDETPRQKRFALIKNSL